MNLEDFKKPFSSKDIEWRVQTCGRKNDKIWALVFAYVTNRAIQDRLDDVAGIENWTNYFGEGADGGVLCTISIKINNEWISKQDGAPNTNYESVKGGLSGAMKRAAVQWGIGRYLYKLDVMFAVISGSGKYSNKTPDGKWFRWNPPQLPNWALPENEQNENPDKEISAKDILEEFPESAISQFDIPAFDNIPIFHETTAKFKPGDPIPQEYWDDRKNPIYGGLWTTKDDNNNWHFIEQGGQK